MVESRSKLQSRLPWAVLIAAWIAYVPVFWIHWLSLSDENALLSDPAFQGLGWAALRNIFFVFQPGKIYEPLRWLSHILERSFCGQAPLLYHLDNLFLHGMNAVLLYFLILHVLRRVSPETNKEHAVRAPLAAAFSALFFALHPLRVEPVAWVAGRGYLLSSCFTLLTVLAYMKDQRDGNPRRFWAKASIAAYALALLSQCAVWTVPVFLILWERYFPHQGVHVAQGQDQEAAPAWLENTAFLIVLGCVGLVFMAHGIYLDDVAQRMLISTWSAEAARWICAIAFPLERTLIPFHLVPWHPQPADFGLFQAGVLIRLLALAGITTWAFVVRRRWPAGLILWSAYIAASVPYLFLARVSGHCQFQMFSDSWSYLPAMVMAIGVGMLVYHPKLELRILWILPFLCILTLKQTFLWKDARALLDRNLAVEPDCYQCHMGLARMETQKGETAPAQEHFQKATDILSGLIAPPRFTSADAGFFLSQSLVMNSRGKLDEAVQFSRLAVGLDASHADAHFNLGYFLSQKGMRDEAIQETRIAVALNPNNATARNNLGFFFQQEGRLQEAVEQYQEALRVDPKNELARNNLQSVLTQLRGGAVKLNPADIVQRINQGLQLFQQGKVDEAIEATRAAVSLAPDNVIARNNLGYFLQIRGSLQEAVVQYREALRIDPNNELALNNLQAVLAMLGAKR